MHGPASKKADTPVHLCLASIARYNNDIGFHRRRRVASHYRDTRWCTVTATGSSRYGAFMECQQCYDLYGNLPDILEGAIYFYRVFLPNIVRHGMLRKRCIMPPPVNPPFFFFSRIQGRLRSRALTLWSADSIGVRFGSFTLEAVKARAAEIRFSREGVCLQCIKRRQTGKAQKLDSRPFNHIEIEMVR